MGWPAERMLLLHVVRLWILTIGFLKLGGAQYLPCTVTQVGEQTLYSVPEFKGTSCNYGWANGTDYVLATHGKDVDAKVVMKTNRTLLTNECINLIHYIRDCISEGMQRTANCTINCSGNARSQIGEISRYWIIVPVVLLLPLLGFLCYWFREHISRRLGCFYTSVKTQDGGGPV